MVMTNHSLEEQVLRFISDTKTALIEKEEQKAVIDKEIETLNAEMQGFQITLHALQKRAGQQPKGIDWINLLAEAKTHKDKILIVLKHLGGLARPNQITDILFTNGFIKSKKRSNAYLIVQDNLAQLIDKKLVEKTSAGDYKLLGAQAALTLSQIG